MTTFRSMPGLPVTRLMLLAAVRHLMTFTAEFRPSAAAHDTQLRVTTSLRVLGRHVKIVFVGRSFRIKLICKPQLRAQNDEVVTGVWTTTRGITADKNENHPMQSFSPSIPLQQKRTWLSASTAFQSLRQRQRLQRQPCRLSANLVRKIVTKCLPRFGCIDVEHVINIYISTCRHFPA